MNRWPWWKRLVAIPLTAGALVVGMVLGQDINARAQTAGLAGFPVTLVYDNWVGRTTATAVQIGATNSSSTTVTLAGTATDTVSGTGATTYQSGTNQDLILKHQGTGKFLIRMQTGDGAGTNTDRMILSSDQVTVSEPIIPTGATDLILKGGTGAGDVDIRSATGADTATFFRVQNAELTANAMSCDTSATVGSNVCAFPQGLSVGGGSVAKMLPWSSAQAQGSIGANSCADSSAIAVAGASSGSACFCSAGSTGFGTGISATCYVNGSGVIVHYCNSGAVSNTPTANTYKGYVVQ